MAVTLYEWTLNVERQSVRKKSESNALASNLSRSKSSDNSQRDISFNMGSLSPTGSHNAHSPSNPSNPDDIMITTTDLGRNSNVFDSWLNASPGLGTSSQNSNGSGGVGGLGSLNQSQTQQYQTLITQALLGNQAAISICQMLHQKQLQQQQQQQQYHQQQQQSAQRQESVARDPRDDSFDKLFGTDPKSFDGPTATTSNRPNSSNLNDLLGMMACTSSSMPPSDLSPSACSPLENSMSSSMFNFPVSGVSTVNSNSASTLGDTSNMFGLTSGGLNLSNGMNVGVDDPMLGFGGLGMGGGFGLGGCEFMFGWSYLKCLT
jgi:hypothetical protein